MPLEIAPYDAGDREACLELIRSNTPEYFAPYEEADFGDFLTDIPGQYWVVRRHGRIVACGGIAQEPHDLTVASLCWGMVDETHHRRGVGRALLTHRIDRFLPDHPKVTRIRVRTTQKVQAFFEKHGFRADSIEKDAYGPGLDKVTMFRSVGDH